jgi:Tol biopolymer transport system component
VHDVGDIDGSPYLVTELVEGGTLRDWQSAGKRTWRHIVSILVGVADGLAAAHKSGILHRDVKPENVLVDGSGYAKLVDFGLAKRLDNAGAQAADAVMDTVSGATPYDLSAPDVVTLHGSLVGTIPYMSPEQTSGGTIDDRSDIFSFGVLLHEALSGARPFNGATHTEIIAAIRDRPAPPLPQRVPSQLRWIVDKSLEKDPNDRYQSMLEVVVDLRRALRSATDSEVHSSAATKTNSPGTSRQRRAVIAVAAVVTVIALAGGFWVGRSTSPAPSMIRQSRLTELSGTEETPAVSPDGRTLAFASPVNGRRQIFVRPLLEGAPVQITRRNDADYSFPRWVDDNTLVYFVAPQNEGDTGSLWETLVPSSTPPRRLGPAQGEADVSHEEDVSQRRLATFRTNDEGTTLAILDRDGATSEDSRMVSKVSEPLSFGSYSSPRWSPDDRRIAFEVRIDLVNAEMRVLDIATGDTQTVVKKGRIRGIAWLPDGSGLVYSSARGSTLAYPPSFSLMIVKVDGSLGDGGDRVPLGGSGYASYIEPDVTRDGRVVASRVHLQSDIFRFPVDGEPRENVSNAVRVTNQTGQVQVPSVSPDGEEIAYLSDSGGHANVWGARVHGAKPPRQITRERDPSVIIAIPRWSPRRRAGGDFIVYYRQRVGNVGEQWLVRPDGTGRRPLVRTGGGASWSADGDWLYHIVPADSETGTPCIEKVHVDSGKQVPVRCWASAMQVTSDGTTGYFCPSSARQGELWRVSPVDTGIPERLPVGDLQSRIPMWPHHYDLSPNDEWLATPLKDGGTTNIFIISTEDGRIEPVTDFQQRATMIARQVCWSSDSKFIFAAVLETDSDIVLLEGAIP